MPSTAPRLRRPSAPMIVALLALFVALGGPAEAARLINGGKIKKGTVGSKQLADGGVEGARPGARGDRPAHRDAARLDRPAAAGHQRGDDRRARPEQRADRQRRRRHADRRGPRDQRGRAGGDRRQRRRAGADPAERRRRLGDRGRLDRRPRGRRRRLVGAGHRAPGRDAAAGTVAALGPDECERRWFAVDGDRPGRQPSCLSRRATTWPHELVYTANATNSSSEFKVEACNRHGGDAAVDPSATYTFRYAVVGP